MVLHVKYPSFYKWWPAMSMRMDKMSCCVSVLWEK
ncbi:Linoleate 9S-lipoxygenase 5, chloroplastic -like protein [Gossypium arboreum]|uniref:Linoleate 9S-lipoxygenase 5, chloroplastic-like protein n=1 Tax=Gossypium arboreum TaxID=29729 RepID=A0A0B0P6X1_GOSAR|nr:Linoleate 9S-lipoxygenase 5, chloroplastic -like protein [Gossypium arboreum]